MIKEYSRLLIYPRPFTLYTQVYPIHPSDTNRSDYVIRCDIWSTGAFENSDTNTVNRSIFWVIFFLLIEIFTILNFPRHVSESFYFILINTVLFKKFKRQSFTVSLFYSVTCCSIIFTKGKRKTKLSLEFVF